MNGTSMLPDQFVTFSISCVGQLLYTQWYCLFCIQCNGHLIIANISQHNYLRLSQIQWTSLADSLPHGQIVQPCATMHSPIAQNNSVYFVKGFSINLVIEHHTPSPPTPCPQPLPQNKNMFVGHIWMARFSSFTGSDLWPRKLGKTGNKNDTVSLSVFFSRLGFLLIDF